MELSVNRDEPMNLSINKKVTDDSVQPRDLVIKDESSPTLLNLLIKKEPVDEEENVY